MSDRTAKQLIGFILFWMAMGMLFMLFMPNHFIGVLIAAGMILLGYHLYCNKR